EVDDALVLGALEAARLGAGGQQQRAVADALPALELDLLRLAVDRGDHRAYADLGAGVLDRVQRDGVLAELGVDPQLLGERGAGVGGVLVGAEDADAAVGPVLAQSAGGIVGDLPSPDDQMVVRGHLGDLLRHGVGIPRVDPLSGWTSRPGRYFDRSVLPRAPV